MRRRNLVLEAVALVALAATWSVRHTRACYEAQYAGNGCTDCVSAFCPTCVAQACPGSRLFCNKRNIGIDTQNGFMNLQQVIQYCYVLQKCEPAIPSIDCNWQTNPCASTDEIVGASTTIFTSVEGAGGKCFDIN